MEQGVNEFRHCIDLANERLGGAALLATDDFFAEKENLLKASRPVFLEGEYTERGKWMDGWESRRKRTLGHDWCIVRLGLSGVIKGVVVDTSHFKGNYPEQCSIEACRVDRDASGEELDAMADAWTEILPKSALMGDSENEFAIESPERWTHVRLRIYPDGGVARLRVHGVVVPDWESILRADSVIDLIAVGHGGAPVASSDQFFSEPWNLLVAYPSANMGDGWETRRRRGPGHDWAVLRLGRRGVVERVRIDTTNFKGNFPDTVRVEVCDAPDDSAPLAEGALWREIVPSAKMRAHDTHEWDVPEGARVAATHARICMHPDGGIARARLYGRVVQDA